MKYVLNNTYSVLRIPYYLNTPHLTPYTLHPTLLRNTATAAAGAQDSPTVSRPSRLTATTFLEPERIPEHKQAHYSIIESGPSPREHIHASTPIEEEDFVFVNFNR